MHFKFLGAFCFEIVLKGSRSWKVSPAFCDGGSLQASAKISSSAEVEVTVVLQLPVQRLPVWTALPSAEEDQCAATGKRHAINHMSTAWRVSISMAHSLTCLLPSRLPILKLEGWSEASLLARCSVLCTSWALVSNRRCLIRSSWCAMPGTGGIGVYSCTAVFSLPVAVSVEFPSPDSSRTFW